MYNNSKPLVTFALFAFNQEDYISEAVYGALSQTYSPLEIILSDDCSTDQTFLIIKNIIKKYSGPHKIILNKNNINYGIGAHVNKIINISTGKYIVGAAGDDISLPDRTTKIVDEFLKHDNEVFSVWSSAKYIDENSILLRDEFCQAVKHNDISIAKNTNPVIGATHAWKKEVFDIFGPLLPNILFEDNAISFRSYLLGGIGFISESLVLYRKHDLNTTNYNRNNSLQSTYKHATKLLKAKSIGLIQRQIDLKTFEFKYKISKPIIHSIINREIIKNNLLISVYNNFPKFKIKYIYHAFYNLNISKIFIRSVLFKIFGDKHVI